MYPESLESTEPYDLVKGHCPHLLEAFEESKKKKATTGRKRTQKEAKAPSQPITQFFTKTKHPHQKRLETGKEEKCGQMRLSESEVENSGKKANDPLKSLSNDSRKIENLSIKDIINFDKKPD